MIWESYPWKRALAADVRRLDRLQLHNGSESKIAAIERTLMTAGFTVRRLIEANKLTNQTRDLRLHCKRYSNVADRAPDHLNWHRLDEFYDLNSIELYEVSLRDFCNMLIHSFIFSRCDEEDGKKMHGLYVSTDRQKGKFLFLFEFAAIRVALNSVAKDEVWGSKLVRGKDNQWIIENFGRDDAPTVTGDL